ncbi:MAG: tripartite tricarboxylate transporter substrate binding protein [Betaproteobacteria bacterium]|nr:MAG: tripartite tricarboxylate transporter substrate binding protein [Betaproteobacteria bacterium]
MNKAIAVVILGLLSLAASAQPYPSKPVKVIVPYPAGSTPDIVGRTLAAKLQSALGQPFVVENRTGAGGNIGADAVAKSPPDGHTLLVAVNGPVAVNKFLYKDMPYDSDKDLLPISLLASSPQMLVAVPALGAGSFKEFIQYLRSNPGRVSYASVGGGSASHLTMELLKSDAKVFAVHIPYRGFPPAVTDMLAGNVHAMFAIIPAVLPHVKTGRIRGLAVTGLKRSALAPDVPSVAELGYPQLESLAWIGLLAPAGTAPAVVSRLSGETVRAMRASDTQESLGKQGFDVVANSPAEFSAWIRSESAKWSRVIRASGASAD